MADNFRDHVMLLVREDDPSLATAREKIKLLVCLHARECACPRVHACMRACVRIFSGSACMRDHAMMRARLYMIPRFSLLTKKKKKS